MEKRDRYIVIGALILAIILMEMIIFGGFGIGIVIGVISYFICFMILLKVHNKQMNLKGKIFLIPISLCTLCFILFSNGTLKFFNILFLMSLLLIQGVEVWGIGKTELFGMNWGKQTLKLGMKLPVLYLTKPIKLISKESVQNKTDIKVIKKVCLGIILSIPLLLIVLILLENIDAAFAGVIRTIFKHAHFDIGFILKRVIVLSILFSICFSCFYGFANMIIKDGINNKYISLDFIIVATVGTILCCLYVVFYLSQLAYFISAFKGVLPKGFTWSEYARRGFFETLPLTIINLIGIYILNMVAKDKLGKQQIYMRALNSFIGVFTLFMNVCALSKMCIYIQNCGLTLLRIYVAWFLVLSGLIIAVILVKNIGGRVPLKKSTFIIFSVMYLGLNYINADYIVAKQNAILYMRGEVKDLTACYNLSSSAIGPLKELVSQYGYVEGKKTSNKKLMLEDIGGEHVLNKVRHMMKHQKWQEWNLADYKAVEDFKDLSKL